MRSPFPGMDPYLEHPARWPGVHARLIVAIANALEESLSLNYIVEVEKRVYQVTPEDAVLVGIPDASIVAQQAQIPQPEGSTATSALFQYQRPLDHGGDRETASG